MNVDVSGVVTGGEKNRRGFVLKWPTYWKYQQRMKTYQYVITLSDPISNVQNQKEPEINLF